MTEPTEAPPPPPPPPAPELPSHPSWKQSEHPPLENLGQYDVTIVGSVGQYQVGKLLLLHRAPTQHEAKQWLANGLGRHPGADVLLKVVALGREGQWQERAGCKFYAPLKIPLKIVTI